MAAVDDTLQRYLDDNQIYALLQQSQEALARNLPASPVQFLQNYFAKIPVQKDAVREVKKIVLLGPPGCGKGTQAKRLIEKYALIQISPGNLLRAEIKENTELGRKCQAFMNAGKLVPDGIIIDLVANYVKQIPKNKGWFFDGFPRTELQAFALKANKDLMPTHVIEFVVDQKEVITRIAGRRFDPQTGNTYHIVNDPPAPEIAKRCIIRDDDKEEVLIDRFRVYNSAVNGIRAVFAHQLSIINVNGLGIDQVWDLLSQKLQTPPQIKSNATKEILPRGPGVVDSAKEQLDVNRAMKIVDRPIIEEIE